MEVQVVVYKSSCKIWSFDAWGVCHRLAPIGFVWTYYELVAPVIPVWNYYPLCTLEIELALSLFILFGCVRRDEKHQFVEYYIQFTTWFSFSDFKRRFYIKINFVTREFCFTMHDNNTLCYKRIPTKLYLIVVFL